MANDTTKPESATPAAAPAAAPSTKQLYQNTSGVEQGFYINGGLRTVFAGGKVELDRADGDNLRIVLTPVSE